jgi:RHS repeat-associated protein
VPLVDASVAARRRRSVRSAAAVRIRYDSFGAVQSSTGATTRRQPTAEVSVGYTGHEHDPELGLVNMRGRMFHPLMRRFVSPDPIAMGAGQGLNRYSYVTNSPYTFVDPTGFTRELLYGFELDGESWTCPVRDGIACSWSAVYCEYDDVFSLPFLDDGDFRDMHPTIEAWWRQVHERALRVGDDAGPDNVVALSARNEQRLELDAEALMAFVHGVFAVWRRDLADRTSRPWLLYAWHDAQAGQLRMSACAAARVEHLPFGCTARRADLGVVVDGFLEGSDHIAWSELEPLPTMRTDDALERETGNSFVLDVYVEPVTTS